MQSWLAKLITYGIYNTISYILCLTAWYFVDFDGYPFIDGIIVSK